MNVVSRPLFRVDAGWLFIVAGLAMLAALAILPGQRESRTMRDLLNEQRDREALAYARLNAYSTFLQEVNEGDPQLIRRLAASQLNLMPKGEMPLILSESLDRTVTEWLDDTVEVAATPPEPAIDTLLTRLASGPFRMWLLGGSVFAIFLGLIFGSPSERTSVAGDEDDDRAGSEQRALPAGAILLPAGTAGTRAWRDDDVVDVEEVDDESAAGDAEYVAVDERLASVIELDGDVQDEADAEEEPGEELEAFVEEDEVDEALEEGDIELADEIASGVIEDEVEAEEDADELDEVDEDELDELDEEAEGALEDEVDVLDDAADALIGDDVDEVEDADELDLVEEGDRAHEVDGDAVDLADEGSELLDEFDVDELEEEGEEGELDVAAVNQLNEPDVDDYSEETLDGANHPELTDTLDEAVDEVADEPGELDATEEDDFEEDDFEEDDEVEVEDEADVDLEDDLEADLDDDEALDEEELDEAEDDDEVELDTVHEDVECDETDSQDEDFDEDVDVEPEDLDEAECLDDESIEEIDAESPVAEAPAADDTDASSESQSSDTDELVSLDGYGPIDDLDDLADLDEVDEASPASENLPEIHTVNRRRQGDGASAGRRARRND